MIVILKPGRPAGDVAVVEQHVRDLGYQPHTIRGEVLTVVAAIGDETQHQSLEALVSLPMVEKVLPVQKRYKLISTQTHPDPTTFEVGKHVIGGGVFHVIAGPCAIESREQLMAAAQAVRDAGATFLRAGAFKPRTSPYAFQGLGPAGLELAREVRAETGLPLVSEVVREADLDLLVKEVDVLQIGARNALNYSLLEQVAAAGLPVILKRGLAATVEEWLLAAEYLAKHGNRKVILCERGIRTFETATRNTLDLSAVALAKRETTLPVFVDPSHAAGRADLIEALSCAAVAVGADGLLIEVHPHPEEACSDAAQQLTPAAFINLMRAIAPFVEAAGKTFPPSTATK